MYLSLLNLNANDADNLVDETEERLGFCTFGKVKSVFVGEREFGGEKIHGAAIKVVYEYGMDPGIQFLDKEKAMHLYKLIISEMTKGTEFLEIDVLEYGAI